MNNLWDDWSESANVDCDYSERAAKVERLQQLEVNVDAITS